MTELTDAQWALLKVGSCPPFQGLNNLQLNCEEVYESHMPLRCAECWEKWLELTKKAE